MKSWRNLLVFVALCSFGCTAPKLIPGAPPSEPQYLVQPPDVLTISVRPAPEIQREVMVRPDGFISFDLVGEIEVGGKTIAQIHSEITKRIRKYIVHPDVTVLLAGSNSRKFYVFGEVRRPGAYPLIGRVRVVEALAMAGGPGQLAAIGRARLTRPSSEGDEAYHVDFEAITEDGSGATNFSLQPGDVIYVPASISGSIGYAIGNIFFPIQQIFGLGGPAVSVATGGV